tara:strand:+ start:337 stop:603 length:267 start_codon:yes stop_codon:yes gene_type:complete
VEDLVDLMPLLAEDLVVQVEVVKVQVIVEVVETLLRFQLHQEDPRETMVVMDLPVVELVVEDILLLEWMVQQQRVVQEQILVQLIQEL